MSKIPDTVKALLLTGTPVEQIKALNAISKEENQEGFNALLDALFSPKVAIKKQILNIFCNMKDVLLLDLWQERLDKADQEMVKEIKTVFHGAGFTPKYVEMGLKYFNDQDKIFNLIAIGKLLARVGEPTLTLDFLRRMMTHQNENVKLTAVQGFAKLGEKACINSLLYAVKAYSERVAMACLDLIGSFKDEQTILPLLYGISNANANVAELIISTLGQFGKEKVHALISKHATPDDKVLLKNSILVAEKMGDATLAGNLMKMYRNEARSLSTGKKIILASDVYLSRLQIEKILKDKYEITEVTTGPLVLTEISKGLPALLIIDKSIPGLSAAETLEAIRKKHKKFPVLVFFSHINKAEKAKLSELEVSGYLLKPFDDQEVKKAVIRAIEESAKEELLEKFADTFKPGQSILKEGDRGGACYIIKSGHVRILKKLPNGRDMILAELIPGDLFGEMALIDSSPRSAGAVASEKTMLIAVGKENFGLMVRQKPEFAMKLIEIFSDRLRKSNETIRNLLSREKATSAR